MKEAELSNKKESLMKIPFQKIDENKLKQLEARINGPNAEGNFPVESQPLLDFDVEQIRTRFSNKSDTNTNNGESMDKEKDLVANLFNIEQKDTQSLLDLNGNGNGNGNNSNKSVGNNSISKKKTPAKKAEKKTKIVGNLQIDFLAIKRNRHDEKNNNSDSNNIEDKEISYEENIEFSSKNIIAHTPLFNKKKENFSIMNNFLAKGGSSCANIVSNSQLNQANQANQAYQSKSQEKNYVQTSINIKSNLNNSSNLSISTLQTSESNFKTLRSLQEENDKTLKEMQTLKKELNDRDKKIRNILMENEDLAKNLTIMSKQFENQMQMSKMSLIKYLRELEELRRSNKKKWLNDQEFRLGRSSMQRVGSTVIEVWENGDEFLKLSYKLKEIEIEKEKLEKQKKNLQNFQKKRSNMNNIGTSSLSTSTVESTEPSQNELNDLKELINFKLSFYQKEETEIREQVSKLDVEKILMLFEKKRLREEESSRFRGFQSKEKFPILAGRYLIISLLGKGGYSEVYKAYDLENNTEVACKIHQLNSQWSDSIKDNYIRHTIRENQIHKEIVHSKIVRHFDTIEIDISSFCTVLELCSGPDLHTYLKMHKQLSEKEARGIIIQIIAGLEYLNKLHRKIIHYDLKPQNIIFHNMEVKISDFGLAKIIENNSDNIELTSQGVGTYWYLPPECFDTSRNPPGISSKVDIWSLGVILFELIYGIRPFGHNYTQDKILQEGVILNINKIEFPTKPSISKPCQDFIEKCLQRKQQDRIDVFEALDHEFIKPKRK